MNDLRISWAVFFIVLAGASVFTLIGSWLVLWRYRRSVARAMRASGWAAGPQQAAESPIAPAVTAAASAPATTSADGERERAQRLFSRAVHAPWVELACIGAGGVAYAIVLASAFLLANEAARTPLRFALTLWVDAWPIVIAAALVGPGFVRSAALGSALYAALFALGTLAAIAVPQPAAESVDAVLLALRDTVTPAMMVRFWLIFAAVPTAVLLLFLNPSLRAVSPLLLTFTTIAIVVVVAAWVAIFAAPSREFIVRLAGSTAGGWAGWLALGGSIVLGLVAAVGAGWLALRAIRNAYLAKSISDRTLVIDALWLFFAGFFSMQFVLEGQAWLLSGVFAFAAYRVVLGVARSGVRRRESPMAPRGLVFLRVFALGPKSSALFDALAKHWRRVGSLQLITGPDLAQSTAQPHQLLDFVSGRLASHFIGDAGTLEARLDGVDRAADRDGWHRINNFFCRADTWQAVLARMVREGDVVLMDLRSFTPVNSGCVHELRHLAEFVPLGRCVFVVDATTDQAHFRSVLREALARAGATSPNRGATAESVTVHPWVAGPKGLRGLLQRLCHAA